MGQAAIATIQEEDKIVAKGSQNDTPLYIVPTVVHFVHDYGNELLADSFAHKMIQQLNDYFAKNLADTTLIIDKYRHIAANTRIAFQLARKDPGGLPTKGVEYIRSYLTRGAYDQSKLNQWPQDRYLNIWVTDVLQSQNSAMVYYPTVAYSIPYYDGILVYFPNLQYGPPFYAQMPIFVAQFLNLRWMCGSTGNPQVCTDGDGIQDTPPCNEMINCTNLYDTVCDTPNVQNVMGPGCGFMFTNGQAAAMVSTLSQTLANRSNLVTTANHLATGINQPLADLPAISEFSVEKGKVSSGPPPAERTYFACAGDASLLFAFKDRSWNDTVLSVHWILPNGTITTDTVTGPGKVINTQFTQPGWVTVSLTATGNNSGSTTFVDDHAVYAADGDNPIVENPATGPMHVIDFAAADTGKWPIFNYYKNSFRWQYNTNAGYYDNTCVQYAAFDHRQFPANTTGSPKGDYDDLFSQAYDLGAMQSGYCNLNFMSAGASRTNNPLLMTDTLEVSYSIDCGRKWNVLVKYGGQDVANNGSLPIAYAPLWQGEWKLNSIEIPVAARTNRVFFRFRYRPGADQAGYSTGNNYYLDRVGISNFPTGLTGANAEQGAILVPNPTYGNSKVLFCGNMNERARISVYDAMGRLVQKETGIFLQTGVKHIDILSGNFTPGLYFVTITGPDYSIVKKLIVCEK